MAKVATKKYESMSKTIIEMVGGVENIEKVLHCMTRLRIVPKDTNKVNLISLKQVEGVIDVIVAGGQYQVVIGTHVSEVYKVLIDIYPMLDGEVEGEEKSDNKKDKKSILSLLMDTISSIFLPIIPALGAAGILKGVLVALSTMGIVADTNDTYVLLYALADAMFYYLPLALAYTAAKKFNCNRMVAFAIVAGMIYPEIIPSFMEQTASYKFFGVIPVNMIRYISSVIPPIIVVYTLSKIERILNKILPSVVKMILVPLLSILIVFPLSIIIIGPITNEVSVILAGFTMKIYNFAPWLAGGVLGLLWPFTVIFGLHWGFFPIEMNFISTLGYNPIGPLTVASNFATAGAIVGVLLKTKNKKLKEVATGAAIPAIIGGITEPGIYGITLKYKKPFYLCCLFTAIGGVIVGLGGGQFFGVFPVCALTLPSIAMFPGGMYMLIASLLSFFGTAITTYLIGFNDNMIKE